MAKLPFKFGVFYQKLYLKFSEVPRRSLLTLVVPSLIGILAIQALTFTPIAKFIDQKVFHPLAFVVREKIRPQKLDPRIKIFTFDNRTAAFLKALDIPLETWGLVIKSIGAKPNVKILISKLFDSPYTETEIKSFSELMSKEKTPTVIQAFTYPGEISYRYPISDETLKSNEQKIFAAAQISKFFEKQAITGKVYGASLDILKSFFAFGHNEYRGDHRQAPLINMAGKGLIPHIALAAMDSLKIDGKNLIVSDRNVSLSSDGKILINFFPKDTYQKASYSLLAVIERAKRSQDISIVNPGDYVLLLPAMYTGSTDYHETPFGSLPGGYVMTAMLNSALSGNWLSEINDFGISVVLLGILGFLLGMFLKPGFAIAALGGATLSLISASLALFVFFGVAFSFVLPLLALMFAGLTGLILHGNLASIEEVRIHKELEVATLVQKSFFPKALSETDYQTKVEGRFIPASECGGDWWGCYRRHGYTYIMLGDAVGHGVPAALVTAVAFSVSRTIDMELEAAAGEPVAPSRFMKGINDVLCEMNSNLACMTFLIFRIHDSSGEAVFANAGNLQPVLIPKSSSDKRLSKDQRLKTLLARGDVLGLGKDLAVDEHSITLVSGDKIALYTDGLIENSSPKTKEPLGKKWLKDVFSQAANETSTTFCDQVWSKYSNEVGASKVADDVTLVVMERS